MVENFAILGVKEIKSMARLAAVGGHNLRTKIPLNADRERLHLNVDLMVALQNETFEERLARVLRAHRIPKVHGRAVLAVEILLGMSPEAALTVPLEKWAAAAEAAGRKIARRDAAIIGMNFHHDEKTPHFHLVFVPLVEVTRKQRGPLPPNGMRPARKSWQLTFAQFAGPKTRDVGETYSGWHDIYAEHVSGLGLARGFPGGKCDHLPQRNLYLRTAQLMQDGETLAKFLEDPSPFFRRMSRPTLSTICDDTRWQAFQDTCARDFVLFVKEMSPQGAHGIIETAAEGIFAQRARKKLAETHVDRERWKARSEEAERRVHDMVERKDLEIQALTRRIDGLQGKPLDAREATALVGLSIIADPAPKGETVHRVVTEAGEVWRLEGHSFLRPDGSRVSVTKFLVSEMRLSTAGALLATLAELIGTARAEATLLQPFRDAARVTAKSGNRPKVDPADALLVLQRRLKSELDVRTESSRQLIASGQLRVNSLGQGAVVSDSKLAAYVFFCAGGSCSTLRRPTNFDPARLGLAGGTGTTVICDDPGLALKVFDVSQGLVLSQLVSPASVTEERLGKLRGNFLEVFATPSVFDRRWNPLRSAIIGEPAVVLAGAATAARGVASRPMAGPATQRPGMDFGNLR